jgi:hypothetical protein
MEATPHGIVARPIKTRLEMTKSRTVLLLPLAIPGEKRRDSFGSDDEDERVHQHYIKVRDRIDKKLIQFRDSYINASEKRNYAYVHSTVTTGGAIAWKLGISDQIAGPVSPAAYIVLQALIDAFVAQNISEKENKQIKPEDFLRDGRMFNEDAVRLRPGYRFNQLITLRDR